MEDIIDLNNLLLAAIVSRRTLDIIITKLNWKDEKDLTIQIFVIGYRLKLLLEKMVSCFPLSELISIFQCSNEFSTIF